MPAGSWKVYGHAFEQLMEGGLDLDTDAWRMVLVTSAYTPNQSADDAWSDISTNEVAAAGGYSTHGKLLTATSTRSGLVITFDCDDQSWTSSTITAKYAVIVRDEDANGSLGGADIPLCYCDLETGGGSVSTSSGTFLVTISASGVFAVTVS